MKVIKVDTDRILEYGKNIKNQRTNIKTEYNEVLAVRSQLDWDIASENGISTRLNKVIHSIEDINSKILELSSFFELAADKYGGAEKKIVKKANNIMKDHPAGILEILKTLYPGDTLKKIWDDYGTIGNASVLSLGISALLKSKPNSKIKFQFFNDEHIRYIKVITEETDYHKLQKLLKNFVGDELSNKNGRFLNKLKEKGIPIYNEKIKGGAFKDNRRLFQNMKFDDISDYIGQLDNSARLRRWNNTKKAFVDNMKFWEDIDFWKGPSKVAKGAKFLGVLGNGIMVGNNIGIAWNNETGNVDKIRRFVVDSTIDLGTGAAVMATGAAIGSAFAPPVGTVVGAVAGFTINFAINQNFGEPPNSLVGHTKDFVNKHADVVVDKVADAVSDAKNAIGSGLKKIFW